MKNNNDYSVDNKRLLLHFKNWFIRSNIAFLFLKTDQKSSQIRFHHLLFRYNRINSMPAVNRQRNHLSEKKDKL